MSQKWERPYGIGAGIIPYIYLKNIVHVLLGKRKPTVAFAGLLSLPAGCIDTLIGGPENMAEWQTHSNPDFISHDPLETAIREAEEEAELILDRSKIEPMLWHRFGYWGDMNVNNYFHSILYPYQLSEDEMNIALAADTNEMGNWQVYSAREIFLLAANQQIAFPQEFEAIKLLIAKLRAERNP